MVSIERQADALFKCGKFDEALSVYEKRLRKHFDADCMSNFIVLKKKVAFTSIEKGEYEKVADILISAEVNPEEEVFERSEEEVVSVVRRQLCPSLKALLEHGMLKKTLTQRSLPSSLGLGCFVTRNGTNSMLKFPQSYAITTYMRCDLFFYGSRNGRDLNEAPVRKLSQSFK
ncbi:hypothetical protein KIN20_033199 [Parelaphostrongylus tenuis]|nr:hypothetical protein KIN20_033199 [Parelaphostrongylus tenuis]